MAKKLRYPTGPVSKAQWRWWYAQLHKGNPAAIKWAHRLTERGERAGPKIHFRSLPPRTGHPGINTLRHTVGKGAKRR